MIENVETYLCRRPDDLEYTLDNLEHLMVKRVGESGGYGMLIGPHSTAKERNDFAALLRADPAGYISQPTLALSRAPCRIVPGAFCRIALRRGSLVVNSSQGGGGKDFWVLDD